MIKKGLVSVIIVNWNGKSFLYTCLSSLSQQTYRQIEIIFVDNASHDDSVAYVKKHFPKVKVVINKTNEGFAQGNNVGYKHVSGEYILFLNNDTKIEKNAIARFVEHFEKNPTIGGMQGKILLMDEPTRLDSVGAFLTHTGILYHYGASKKDSATYSKEIFLYSAKGAFMIFRKKILESIEVNKTILDERYFCYFEETDMCHRVWLAGSTITYLPSAIVYHKLGGTSTKLNNAFVQYHSVKNRVNSYLKNLAAGNIFLILPVHLLIVEVFGLINVFQGNWQLFFAIQKALLWNVTNVRKTLKKRRYIQKHIRKLSDASLFQYILKDVGIDYYLDMPFALIHYKDKQIAT